MFGAERGIVEGERILRNIKKKKKKIEKWKRIAFGVVVWWFFKKKEKGEENFCCDFPNRSNALKKDALSPEFCELKYL